MRNWNLNVVVVGSFVILISVLASSGCVSAPKSIAQITLVKQLSPSVTYTAAWSPSKKLVAVSGQGVKLYQATTMTSTLSLGEDSFNCTAIGFSKDGAHIATGHLDGMVRVWEVSTGKMVSERKGHVGPVYSLASSPNGCDCFLTGGHDKCIRVWSWRDLRRLQEWQSHDRPVVSLAVCSVSPMVASGSHDGVVYLWDFNTNKPLQPSLKLDGVATALSFSADGKKLWSGTNNRTITEWDVQTLKSNFSTTFSSSIRALGYVAARNQLLAVGGDQHLVGSGTSMLCALNCCTEKSVVDMGIPTSIFGPITTVAVSPDETAFVCVSEQGQIGIWRFSE